MAVSAGANLQWLGAAATSVPPATMALAPRVVKPASAALRGRSAACVTPPVGSAPAELVHLGFAATAANGASGGSRAAGPVSATGTQTSATPTLALASAAGTTLGVSTVKGALLASMGTLGCPTGASAGPAPAPKGPGACDTSLLPATGMGTHSRSCATAGQATQGCDAKLVPPGTLGTHQGQAAGANHVSAVGTLTPRTRMPVTPARGNACTAYTTRRGRAVPTASLASMGRPPDRAVTAVPATCWAQIPDSARPLTAATVTQAVGSAHASPTSRA